MVQVDGGQVYYVEFVVEYFIIGQVFEFFGIWVFEWVGSVYVIDFGSFKDYVGVDFDGVQVSC